MSQRPQDAGADQPPAVDILGNAFRGSYRRGYPVEEWLVELPALHNNDDVKALGIHLHTFLADLKERDYGNPVAFRALVARAREVEACHQTVVKKHNLTDHPWIPVVKSLIEIEAAMLANKCGRCLPIASKDCDLVMEGRQKKVKCRQCQHDKKQCEWSSIIPLALLDVKFSIQQEDRVDIIDEFRRATKKALVVTGYNYTVEGENLVRLMNQGFNELREPLD